MSFNIRVSFLMHMYQGADETGKPELFPSQERLYRALVSVAYGVFGFKSSDSQESTIDDQSVREALAWMEGNPPDAIRLPAVVAVSLRNTTRAVAYRNQGSWDKKLRSTTKAAAAYSSVAYDISEAGDLVWQWQESPSPRVIKVLGDLCWEVPYLGEACTPVHVVTESGDEYPLPESWKRTEGISLSSLQSMIVFHIPWNGHLQELQQGYLQAYPKCVCKPSETKQEMGASSKNVLSNTLYVSVRQIGYTNAETGGAGDNTFIAPWNQCFFIPVTNPQEWRPRENQLVAWAVAMHRLLVRQWGSDVSPMLTGRYLVPDGFERRPANNVAIHVLTSDVSSVVTEELRGLLPGFLIMVPYDMPVAEVSRLAEICDSVEGRSLFYSAKEDTLRLGGMQELESTHIWAPVPDRKKRFWFPYPLCIRETYPVKHPTDRKRRWGTKESIALAIGHTLRDSFSKAAGASGQRGENCSESENGNDYWSLIERVCAADSPVRIYNAHPESRTMMADYVHRTQRNALLAGASAWLSFSDECGLNQTVMAIGQTRHLGGGLLIPLDISNILIDNVSGRPVCI